MNGIPSQLHLGVDKNYFIVNFQKKFSFQNEWI